MCPTNWYTLAVCFIIFQKIPITYSTTRPPAGKSDGCRQPERFAKTIIWPNTQKDTLNIFKLECTAVSVFEVRFTNEQLCGCGKVTRVEKTLTISCQNRLSLDAMVSISVANVGSRWGENCTFEFHFRGGAMRQMLSMTILPAQVTRSSYVVYNTHVITSYVTSAVVYTRTVSLIGQRSTTSSPIIRQSKLRNSTRVSRRIRSNTVNSQSFQSSHAIPFYSEIIITSAVIHQSTVSSVYHRLDLATSSLPTEPAVVMSSHESPLVSGNVITSTSVIQHTNSSVYHSPDLATSGRPIEPVVVTSSHAIPFISGIVITPTPTIQPPNSSFYHSSDLATSSLSTEPVMVTSSLKESPVLKTSTFIKSSPTTSLSTPSSALTAGEEKRKKLKEDIDFINNVNTSAVDINDNETISRLLDAAANLINTNITIVDEKEDPGMRAVEVLQNLGQTISQQLDLGNQSSVTFQEGTKDLVFGAAVINVSSSPGFEFPSENGKISGDEKIYIPKSVFVSESGKAYFVGMIFKAYLEMRNNTGNEGFVMGTKVINAIVSPAPNKVLDEPVEMTFEKSFVGKTFAEECSFYIENNSLSGEHGRWSTRECFRTFQDKSHVKCHCYHFTNFAVLFKITDDQTVSKEDTFRLVIITYIGLSLSILGCLLTFIIYISLNIKSDRAAIHTNLVLALGIADVIFLVTVAVKPDGDSCLAVAILAFYFYLAVFFWMLVEGVYIYLMVIKVFRGNVARRRRLAYLVGWGCPIIIAIVTLAILTDDVVSKYHCWLSVESGAIWAFVGPGLFIILVNFIILMSVMRTTWAHFADDKEYGGLKSATKTFGAVIPILGITWVFGVMAFNESSIVFQYIFAITNSIQGLLIFLLYCIVNNEVRSELHRRFKVWQTRREMTSSSGGGRRTTDPYVISSEKNTTFNRTTQSAQATPDLLRYPLNEIKPEKPVLVEQRYSFEDSNKTPKKDTEFHVDVTNGAPDHEVDRDGGRSSPADVEKVPEVTTEAGDNSAGDV